MSLAKKFEEKLIGGKFRLLNEKMYKDVHISKEQSRKYHEYYAKQISKWPADPNKIIFDKIEEMGNFAKIADLGCGDAKYFLGKPNVFLYDKYPVHDRVVEADLTAIPCDSSTFDVTVCCLSLMMTYISKVLLEVNRITRTDGQFIVAEVKSRFGSVHRFVKDVEKYGFKVQNVDTSNSCFVVMTFRKVNDIKTIKKLPTVSLKPCVYKKR